MEETGSKCQREMKDDFSEIFLSISANEPEKILHGSQTSSNSKKENKCRRIRVTGQTRAEGCTLVAKFCVHDGPAMHASRL